MKITFAFLLALAFAAPSTGAFAGASNPMSQSYNAVQKGKNETQRMDSRKMQKPARTTQQQPKNM